MLKKYIIVITVLIFLGFGAYLSSQENKNPQNQNSTQAIEEELFNKEQALKRVQDYKIKVNLKSPIISSETTLFDVYEIRGKLPAIKNLGWFINTKDENTFIVSFKQETDLGIDEPIWEVNRDNINAINGEALNYTPELGENQKDTGGTEFERQVYETFSGLAKKYTDEVFVKYSDPSNEQLDNAEQKALSETATKYQITIEQVREIFTRLDKERYSQ